MKPEVRWDNHLGYEIVRNYGYGLRDKVKKSEIENLKSEINKNSPVAQLG